jgi:hypothetical protein
MGITVTWDNEDRTSLRLDFAGLWTWEEYDEAVDCAYFMIAQSVQKVDIITNLSRDTTLPGDDSLRHFQRALRQMPSNVGLTVTSGGNSFSRKVFSSFQRTLAAGSLGEARAILANRPQLHAEAYLAAS